MREIVGKNIRALRKAKGWTIEDLAGRVESDVGNISRLERGKQGFTDAILEKVASALDVKPAALFAEAETVSRDAKGTTAVLAEKKQTLKPAERQWLELFQDLDVGHQKLALVALKAVRATWEVPREDSAHGLQSGPGHGAKKRAGGQDVVLRKKRT